MDLAVLCQGVRYDGAFNVGGVFQESVGGEEGAAEFGSDLDGRCVVEIPDRVFGDCSGATAQEVRGNLVGFLVGVEDHRRRAVAVEFELEQAEHLDVDGGEVEHGNALRVGHGVEGGAIAGDGDAAARAGELAQLQGECFQFRLE